MVQQLGKDNKRMQESSTDMERRGIQPTLFSAQEGTWSSRAPVWSSTSARRTLCCCMCRLTFLGRESYSFHQIPEGLLEGMHGEVYVVVEFRKEETAEES